MKEMRAANDYPSLPYFACHLEERSDERSAVALKTFLAA
jgi:hypothetical protein